MAGQFYLIAFGANRRGRWGRPAEAIARAMDELGADARSPLLRSEPLGVAGSRYTNAVARVASDLAPPALLAELKALERAAGRRKGRRWGDRPLDLDIIGWSGGQWSSLGLTVPHPEFRQRGFVLTPLAIMAPRWRDPVSGLTARQLRARLDRRRPRP